MFRSRSSYMALFVVCTFVSVPASAAVRYVKPTPTGAANCTSWANACTLPTALGVADPLTSDQIWVKSGTYAPIGLVNGVKLIGGFGGAESAAAQSNPTGNITIIDGGLSAPCVTSINPSPSALSPILRGFTLRNGRDSDDEGGGMLLENSNAIIAECTFEENSATHFGGALSVRGAGSPQFVNCIFRKNGTAAASPRDTKGGGAIYVREGTPLFVNCLFEGNKAGQGGVVFVREGLPTFIHCTMVKNESMLRPGGAVSDPNGQVTLKNCILWNNKRWVDSDGPGGPQPPVSVADQIAGRDGASFASYSDVQGAWGGPNDHNIHADPLFVNPAAADYRLDDSPASPCLDTGDNGVLPPDVADLNWNTNTVEPLPYDLARGFRVSNGAVDMGAYELYVAPPAGCCIPEQPCGEVLTETACGLAGGSFRPQHPTCETALCPCLE